MHLWYNEKLMPTMGHFLLLTVPGSPKKGEYREQWVEKLEIIAEKTEARRGVLAMREQADDAALIVEGLDWADAEDNPELVAKRLAWALYPELGQLVQKVEKHLLGNSKELTTYLKRLNLPKGNAGSKLVRENALERVTLGTLVNLLGK
jgi:hypothetical protein